MNIISRLLFSLIPRSSLRLEWMYSWYIRFESAAIEVQEFSCVGSVFVCYHLSCKLPPWIDRCFVWSWETRRFHANYFKSEAQSHFLKKASSIHVSVEVMWYLDMTWIEIWALIAYVGTKNFIVKFPILPIPEKSKSHQNCEDST